MAVHLEVIHATVPDHVVAVVGIKDDSFTHEYTVIIGSEDFIIHNTAFDIINLDVLASEVELLSGRVVTILVNLHVHMVTVRLEFTAFSDKLSVPITSKLLWLINLHTLNLRACTFSVHILEILKDVFTRVILITTRLDLSISLALVSSLLLTSSFDLFLTSSFDYFIKIFISKITKNEFISKKSISIHFKISIDIIIIEVVIHLINIDDVSIRERISCTRARLGFFLVKLGLFFTRLCFLLRLGFLSLLLILG